MIRSTFRLLQLLSLTLRLNDCLRLRLLSRARFYALALCAFCFAASSASAQNVQYTQGEVGSGLDQAMQVPLRTYQGRGEASLPITLYYSSKVWRIGYINSVRLNSGIRNSIAEAIYAEDSTAGWTTGLDLPRVEWPKQNDLYWYDGKPYHNSIYPYTYRVANVFIHLPGGVTHELRKSDQVYQNTGSIDMYGTFYAVDGSRLRYDSLGPDAGTLYLPDGSRYVLSGGGSGQFIDRNGNTMSYDASTGQWTDSLGRVIGMPWPANPQATDYYYTPPGMPAPYVFKWRYLSTALTPDGQGQTPALKAMSSHYLPYPGSTPTDQNSYNFPQPSGLSSLYFSDYGDPDADNPELSYTYVVGRGQTAGQLFNPVVLAEIVQPDGASYKFSYNIYGELDKVIYPTGGYNRYQYGVVQPPGNSLAPYNQASRGINTRWVSPNGMGGADEAQWQYQAMMPIPFNSSYLVRTIAPDGTRTDTYKHNILPNDRNFGYQDARNGMIFDEQVFAPDGTMLRRSLTEWAQASATYNKPRPTSGTPATGTYTAYRNVRSVKTVNLLLDTGTDALTTTATYFYDTSYQFSTGVELTSLYEYHYAPTDQTTAQTGAITAMPFGTLARISETSYLTYDPSYRNRNLLGLPTLEVIKDSSGNVVARKETLYDESAYPLLTYGAVTGWTDPATSARGNPTTVRQYTDPAAGSYIETHTQYDQCGSERNAWDPHDPSAPGHGHMSQIFYDDAFSDAVNRNTFAYPTRTVSPVPDPSGTRASSIPLEKRTVYDYSTGLVSSTTDANGQTTTNYYVDDSGNADPLKRLRKVSRPAGAGWTKYVYGVANNAGFNRPYVQTIVALNGSQESSSYQFFDGLGRPDRAFVYVGPGAFDTTDTQYDSLGRVYKVSQPYRTAGSNDPIPATARWTTTTYDSLGRVRTVTTTDGAVAETTYSGNETTFTDQTLKRRRSQMDALGRMVKVIEDPLGVAYQTNYTYDVLGNLRKIEQGQQVRYFMYDGISRLLRAKNPEQGAQPAITGYDPLTGNTQWSLAISYDLNGNIQSRTDARGVVTNYTYDSLNRQLTISYQSDPANTPGVDFYYDNQPNAMGALWKMVTASDSNELLDRNTVGNPQRSRQGFYSGGIWRYYDITCTYDLAGNITSQTYPSGHTISYQYDLAGRLNDFRGTLGDGVSRVYSTGVTYDEAGRRKQEQFGTATPVYNKSYYNVRGQLSEIRVATTPNDTFWNRGAIINHYSDYSWAGSGTDNNGNLKKQDVYIPNDDAISGYSLTTSFYSYDSLNRLDMVRETRNGANSFVQDYDYDRYGNRTINTTNTWGYGINNKQFSVDPSTNRLGVPAGQAGTMAYDNVGNLTTDTYSGAAGTRAFDAENRLYQELTPSNYQTARYGYDGGGRRVRRTVGGQERWQVYGVGGELIAEYLAGGSPASPTKEYGYRDGELLITASGQGCGAGYRGTKTWGATSPSLGHLTGQAQGSDWVATAGVDSPQHMSYGPYDNSFGQGHHTAQFLLQVDNTSGSDVVATLDVVTGFGSNILAQRQIRRNEFTAANQWQWFTLEFDDPCFGLLEARIYWYGNTSLRFNQLTINGGGGVNNLAQGKSATQSSEGWGGAASRAVDGNVDGNWNDGSVTHTLGGTQDWWQVDLGSVQSIGTIRVWNRTDCCADRLSNFYVLVSDTPFTSTDLNTTLGQPGVSNYYTAGQGGTPTIVAVNRTGRYVRVQLAGTNYLSLAEVEVLGQSGGSSLVQWLVSDQLGTPRMILDQTGNLSGVSRHDYLPFGEEIGAGVGGRTSQQGYFAEGTRQQFTGHERDAETGLDFMQARHYSSQQGRFVSVDTVMGTLSDPQSMNLYAYTVNNPLRYADPSGHAPMDIGVVQTDDPALARAAENSSYNDWIRTLRDQREQKQRQRQQKQQQPQQQQRKQGKPKQTAIAQQLAQIRKNAKPLKPGEPQIPTTMVYLPGDTVTLNGEILELPDGTPASKKPLWGKVRVNAVVVLDQGGNIIGAGSGYQLLERVAADPNSPDAVAAEARGEIVSSRQRLIDQHTDGLYYDVVGARDDSAAASQARFQQSFDVRITQTLYLKQNVRETLLFQTNKHQITNSAINTVVGQSKPWPKPK